MIKIHWWEQYGRITCHRNERGLTFDESLLGEVEDDDSGWRCRAVGSEWDGPHRNQAVARARLLKILGAEPVNTWD